MSRVKRAVAGAAAVVGVFGAGALSAPAAGADTFPTIHERVDVDLNQISDDTGLFPNGIIRFCVVIGPASPDPNCIHI